MKQKTPMQQLIERLKKISEKEKLPAKVAYLVAISQAEQLLELEKQTIVDAHIFAHCEHGGGKIFPSEQEQHYLANDYFTQTFEQ